MKKKFQRLLKYQPILIAVISLCIFIFIILQYTEFSNEKKEKDSREKLFELLISKRSQLEKALYSRIYYTKGIAAYCSINPEISTGTFYHLADELIRNDSVISSMALSKNCILGAIYPSKGHESAIGLNLLAHPFRRKIVESTIKTRNTFVAGPVELVEGGIAFISYTPIFTKPETGSSKFWGVTDIVILENRLFNEVKLRTQDSEYKYALKGVDGAGLNGGCFWGDSTIFNNSPVTVDILLPTGKWVMASVPVNGWESSLNKTERITIILYISALIISILIGLLAKAIIIQKEAVEELKKSKQKLLELNAAKDKFFSIIAHDLKGPFSGIMGVTEELKANIDQLEKEEISEFAGLMYSAAKNTFDLLNNLLEWSSLQTGRMSYNPDNINVYSIVQNTCELFKTTASVKSICIENKVESELKAFADKNMTATILRNLISNSIKFTKPEGKISIASSNENGFIKISIADTGVGMTDDVLDKIFKIDSVHIARGTNGEKGTGLGLLLCKELVEKNGGIIKVKSNPGSGTEFTFTLPAYRI